jgi:hypothetical protein
MPQRASNATQFISSSLWSEDSPLVSAGCRERRSTGGAVASLPMPAGAVKAAGTEGAHHSARDTPVPGETATATGCHSPLARDVQSAGKWPVCGPCGKRAEPARRWVGASGRDARRSTARMALRRQEANVADGHRGVNQRRISGASSAPPQVETKMEMYYGRLYRKAYEADAAKRAKEGWHVVSTAPTKKWDSDGVLVTYPREVPA